ncbi:MAG: hypothetical protein KAJ51_17525, partial [Thermoplasmata archaeon]|nr:hypothetical protein [Thermoplasmata archaeon]
MNKKQRILIILAIILLVGIIGASLGYYYSDSLKNPVFKRDLDGDFDKDYVEFNRTPPREYRNEIEKARENFDEYVSIKTAVTLINIVLAVI